MRKPPFTRGKQETYADGIREALGCIRVLTSLKYSPCSIHPLPIDPFSVINSAEEEMELLLNDMKPKALALEAIQKFVTPDMYANAMGWYEEL